MRKLLLCLALLFTSIGLISARTIKGTVSDQDGELPGASVVVKGTTKGTTTDLDGKFEIDVEDGQTLQFSFVGNKTQDVKITSSTKSPLKIVLKADDKVLDELVVVGYGVMKKSDLTGSVAGVKADKLKETTSASIDQALQGRVSGVAVTASSGQPGAATSVRVRGTSSLTGNNEPLYVVDGMPIGGAKQTNGSNPLAAINPADIEKMEVLKDASATAIYGSKAANGVIMITTKKGKSGDAKISYSGQLMLSEAPKKLDMMNLREYAEFYSQPDVIEALNPGDDPLLSSPYGLGSGTDWQDEVFQTGLGHQHMLSVSGGSEKSRYSFSFGYLNQDGVVINTNYERFNGRVNLETDAKKWLTMGVSMAYTRSDQTKQKGFEVNNDNDLTSLSNGGSFEEDNPILQGLKNRPTDAPYDAEGNYFDTRNATGTGKTTGVKKNPVQSANLEPIYFLNNNIFGNTFANIKFINKGPQQLFWRNEFGIDLNSGKESQYKSASLPQNAESNFDKTDRSSFYYRGASTLTYMNTFKDIHNVSVMVGAELSKAAWEGTTTNNFGHVGDTFFDEEYQNTALASSGDTDGYRGDVRTISYLTRLNYSFKQRYSLTATGRYDGSSTLSEDHRWGFFPSFAFAWNIKNEGFLADNNNIGELKLRLGYGQTGNAGTRMNYLAAYVQNKGIDGDNSHVFYQQGWPNVDLVWETNWQINAGLDFGFIKGNRVRGSFDVYLKRNKDLINAAQPGFSLSAVKADGQYTGASDINVGTVENKGFDLSINTKNIDTKIKGLPFTWGSDLNFSLVRNKVVDLGGQVRDEQMYMKTVNHNICRTQEGEAPGLFYGYKTDGLIMNSAEANRVVTVNGEQKRVYMDGYGVGDLKFVDANGDGFISEDDKTFIGDPNPDFTCGLGNSFSLGNEEKSGVWTLNVMLNATVGNDVFNLIKMNTEGLDEANVNYLSSALDYARVKTDANNEQYIENAGTDVPRPTSRAAINAAVVSDRYVEDGSFLRISNIGLSYSFPTTWVKKMYLERLSLSANVQNIYTFTNYSGFDPEVPNGQPMLQGIDYGSYPNPRMFVFGVDINF